MEVKREKVGKNGEKWSAEEFFLAFGRFVRFFWGKYSKYIIFQ